MKNIQWILCVVFLMPGFVGAEEAGLVSGKQLVEQAKTQIQVIEIDELASMRDKDAIIIDVREPDETGKGIIPDAEIIPRGILEFRVARIAEDPDQPIVVYCRSGNRSALAALTLQNMGYRQVYSLEGGWKAWDEAREPGVLSPPDEDTAPDKR